MLPIPGARNLNISREVAVGATLLGTVFALAGIAVGILVYGIDATSTPVIVGICGTLGILVNGLVSALKSAEAADTSAKARNIAARTHDLTELTASQNASLHQTLLAHCGDICPLDTCPLRRTPLGALNGG